VTRPPDRSRPLQGGALALVHALYWINPIIMTATFGVAIGLAQTEPTLPEIAAFALSPLTAFFFVVPIAVWGIFIWPNRRALQKWLTGLVVSWGATLPALLAPEPYLKWSIFMGVSLVAALALVGVCSHRYNEHKVRGLPPDL
jgi:hypothetical protein